MSAKHLKRYPHKIDENAWWYEEEDGIHIVVNGADKKIGWEIIRRALKRKDKK